MNRKKSTEIWKGICRALVSLAGVLLVCLSAAAALEHYGVPWESWLSDRARGVMAYLEIEGKQLPGSVTIVSTGDVRPVEWSGVQSAVISGSDVELMSDPSASANILCRMSGGKNVVLTGQQGNWYKLRYSCFTGWVPLNYVVPEGERTEYAAGSLESERAAHAADAADIARIASDSDAGRQLDIIASRYGTVGAQAAVIKNGEVVYVHSYGYANRKTGKPITDDTKIRIASLSKVGVAMAAMAMAEQGIVDLDADISDYLGFEVRNPTYFNTPLTLRMLLTHNSTLITDIAYNETYKSFLQKLGMKSSYRNARPGEDYAWEYSNSGLCLAGMVLEAAADVVLVDYIDNYFFAPMGVDASYHASHISDSELIADLYNPNKKLSQSVKNQLARPYSKEPGKNFRLYAGDLTISAKDLARMTCILADDGTYDGTYYMSPQTVEAMQQEQLKQGNFAQCITIRYKEDFIGGHNMYYHTGKAYGTLSFAAYDDETRDGVVIITTGADESSIKGISAVCYHMADYLAGIML